MFLFGGLPVTHALCGTMHCYPLPVLCGKKRHLRGVSIFQGAAVRTQLVIWASGGSTGPPSQNTARTWPDPKE